MIFATPHFGKRFWKKFSQYNYKYGRRKLKLSDIAAWIADKNKDQWWAVLSNDEKFTIKQWVSLSRNKDYDENCEGVDDHHQTVRWLGWLWVRGTETYRALLPDLSTNEAIRRQSSFDGRWTPSISQIWGGYLATCTTRQAVSCDFYANAFRLQNYLAHSVAAFWLWWWRTWCLSCSIARHPNVWDGKPSKSDTSYRHTFFTFRERGRCPS